MKNILTMVLVGVVVSIVLCAFAPDAGAPEGVKKLGPKIAPVGTQPAQLAPVYTCYGGFHVAKHIDENSIGAVRLENDPHEIDGKLSRAAIPRVVIVTDTCLYRINVRSLGEAAALHSDLVQNAHMIQVVQPEGEGLRCSFSPSGTPKCEAKIWSVLAIKEGPHPSE